MPQPLYPNQKQAGRQAGRVWLGWAGQLGARVWSLNAPHTLRDIPILEPPVTTLDPAEVRDKLEGQVLEGAHGKGWVSRYSPGHVPFGRCLQFLLQSGSKPLELLGGVLGRFLMAFLFKTGKQWSFLPYYK